MARAEQDTGQQSYLRSEVKQGQEKPSGEGSSSQAVQHLEPESFFEEKSLGKEATESLGRRKLKDPPKRWVKRTPREEELERPGPPEP